MSRKFLVGLGIVVAAIAAVFILPGGLVLVPLTGLVVGAFYARRWTAEGARRPRRILASVAIAGAAFVVGSIIWVIFVAAAAYECEYEEVQCSAAAEFVAANFAWGFFPIAAFSLAGGWLVTSQGSRRRASAG